MLIHAAAGGGVAAVELTQAGAEVFGFGGNLKSVLS
jgi:hypothetical protein